MKTYLYSPILLLFYVVLLYSVPLSMLHANPMSGVENFVDRPGHDYHHFKASHASVCSTSCATADKCKAYSFVRANGMCWLKDGVPAAKESQCCISGVKVMSKPAFNTDRPGSDLKSGFAVVTQSQCESACAKEGSCSAYTFVKPGVQGKSAMCWLKKSKPAPTTNNCCISGYRLKQPNRVSIAPQRRLLLGR